MALGYLADISNDWMLGTHIPFFLLKMYSQGSYPGKSWVIGITANRWGEREKMLSIRSCSFFSLWENGFLKSVKGLEENVKAFKAEISFSIRSWRKWRYWRVLGLEPQALQLSWYNREKEKDARGWKGNINKSEDKHYYSLSFTVKEVRVNDNLKCLQPLIKRKMEFYAHSLFKLQFCSFFRLTSKGSLYVLLCSESQLKGVQVRAVSCVWWVLRVYISTAVTERSFPLWIYYASRYNCIKVWLAHLIATLRSFTTYLLKASEFSSTPRFWMGYQE